VKFRLQNRHPPAVKLIGKIQRYNNAKACQRYHPVKEVQRNDCAADCNNISSTSGILYCKNPIYCCDNSALIVVFETERFF